MKDLFRDRLRSISLSQLIYTNLTWLLLLVSEALRQQGEKLHLFRSAPWEKVCIVILSLGCVNIALCTTSLFEACLTPRKSRTTSFFAEALRWTGICLICFPLFLIFAQPLQQIVQSAVSALGWSPWFRHAGTAAALAFCLLLGREMRRTNLNRVRWAAVGRPLVLGLASIALMTLIAIPFQRGGQIATGNLSSKPNILLITIDGLDADRLSLYGYALDNTPFLRSLIPRALIARQAHSPASGTYPATASLLSGRSPLSSNIYWYPQSMKGAARNENFLVELEKAGYRRILLHHRLTDPYLMNMRKRSSSQLAQLAKEWNMFLNNAMEQIIRIVPHRLAPALLKVPFLHSALASQSYGMDDSMIIDYLLERVLKERNPFVAHVHLMETHCCRYAPKRLYFSSGTEPMLHPNGYDDAIRNADDEVAKVFKFLDEKSLSDRTIVVIASDHSSGDERQSEGRVPLVFVFPKNGPRGYIDRLVSLEDVAPTLMDFIKLPVPEWSSGYSLLRPDLVPRGRKILGVWRHHNSKEKLNRRTRLEDPLFGAERWTVVGCRKWFKVEPETEAVMEEGSIERSEDAECDDSPEFIDRASRKAVVSDLLQRHLNPLAERVPAKTPASNDALHGTFDSP